MPNKRTASQSRIAVNTPHFSLGIGHWDFTGQWSVVSGHYRSVPLRSRRQAGFTLAEVLAALLFMAIVIPVAVQGLKIANQAGEVAVRKAEASRVAERVLNESIITTNWNKSTPSGVAFEGMHQFNWSLRNSPWLQEPIRLLSVQVNFAVQGQPYDVHLSTLVDNSPPQ